MDPLLLGLLGIVIVLALIFIRMPIAIAMSLVGLLGIRYLVSWKASFTIAGSVPFSSMSYALVTLPLFILMGGMLEKGGIADDIFSCSNKLLGGARGSLAIATIIASAGFAAVSGSSMATVATIGKSVSTEMRKQKNYPKVTQLNLGAVAGGGCLGILIPPSGIMIIYGVLMEASIGKLFMAGIVPGIIEALLFILAICLICYSSPSNFPSGSPTTIMKKIVSLKQLWALLALFLLIIGGIHCGFFSPTEAAGIGAIGAFVIVLLKHRFSWNMLIETLTESVVLGVMILFLMVGANILGTFVAMTGLPNSLASFITSLDLNPTIIIILIMIMYLILGCFMDSMAMLMLTVPILTPVVLGLGFDIIWFGVFVVIAMEMAQITPPIGINVFILKGIYYDYGMGTMFKGIFPFLLAQIVLMILIILFPNMVLFLPSTMN